MALVNASGSGGLSIKKTLSALGGRRKGLPLSLHAKNGGEILKKASLFDYPELCFNVLCRAGGSGVHVSGGGPRRPARERP